MYAQLALPNSNKETEAGERMRLQLFNMMSCSCQMFAGLMEGREDPQAR
jgi:hypothetical protein